MDMSNSPRPVVAAYTDSDALILSVARLSVRTLTMQPASVNRNVVTSLAADVASHGSELFATVLAGFCFRLVETCVLRKQIVILGLFVRELLAQPLDTLNPALNRLHSRTNVIIVENVD
jgi:hypothetical protein